MSDERPTAGPQRRLAEELGEHGIDLGDDPVVVELVLQELDYARRVPMFEGRRPLYGSITLADRPLAAHDVGLDLVPVDDELAAARTYADGRSSYVVRHRDGGLALACFDRPLQYEADLVRLQEATGAHVVQRTPVFGVVRLFRPGSIVAWDGSAWRARSTASAMVPAVAGAAPWLGADVVRSVLDLAVHWLSPGRVGATLVVRGSDVDDGALDVSSAARPPPLSITNRRHFPALLASLQQHDLATLVTADGRVEAIGVGLLSSADAEAAVAGGGGMRHRSAQRWSFDHPSAVVAVVSEDGPVTVYCDGRDVVG